MELTAGAAPPDSEAREAGRRSSSVGLPGTGTPASSWIRQEVAAGPYRPNSSAMTSIAGRDANVVRNTESRATVMPRS